MYRQKILLFLILFADALWSQSDTATALQVIEVKAKSIKEKTVGGKSYSFATDAFVINSVADVLQKNNMAYIKNYGPATLATSSIRGGSGSQTLVLWNNLPIQSPTLGLLDMSLLATDGIDEVNVHEGGNATLWGSGAIAGVIGLNNKLPVKNNFKIKSSIGSFGTYKNNASLQLLSDKWSYDVKAISQVAKNNFNINLPNINQQQTNANQEAYHFLQNISYRLNSNQLLTLHSWYLNSHRNIPPTLYQKSSTAMQEDISLRNMLHYRFIQNTFTVNARIAHNIEDNNYKDNLNKVDSKNNFSSTLFDVGIDKNFNSNNALTLGTSYFHTSATTAGYKQARIENRLAIFASHLMTIKNLSLQSGIRLESTNNIFAPISPSVGLNYDGSKILKLRARINRNYRFPSLNDLYWNPGGNQNLLPESGWSREAGFDIKSELKSTSILYSFTAYDRKIKNWIQWGLKPKDLFYSALNIAEVWSRGINQSLTYDFKINKTLASINASYLLTYSTHLAANVAPKIDAGQQLWYTPRQNFGVMVKIKSGNLMAAYDHHFLSSSLGINENIAAYNFGNLDINYVARIFKEKVNFFVNVNNIFGKNYFVVERRPMPGRYLELGFKTSINLNNNNKQ